jgi:hypothetical protein
MWRTRKEAGAVRRHSGDYMPKNVKRRIAKGLSPEQQKKIEERNQRIKDEVAESITKAKANYAANKHE